MSYPERPEDCELALLLRQAALEIVTIQCRYHPSHPMHARYKKQREDLDRAAKALEAPARCTCGETDQGCNCTLEDRIAHALMTDARGLELVDFASKIAFRARQ